MAVTSRLSVLLAIELCLPCREVSSVDKPGTDWFHPHQYHSASGTNPELGSEKVFSVMSVTDRA